MAVFSRYQKVLETDGTPMRVRTALALINQMLDEALSEQESDFDPDTRFALAWFEQFQFDEGKYGQAEVLATAKAISVRGLDDAGIARVRAGNVRLLKRSELSDDWNPTADGRLTVWQATQHLIRALDHGIDEAGDLAGRLGGLGETARELAYRLYTICERKGWAEEAQAYNGLVVNWPDIRKHAEEFTLQ
jgi:putative DNA methylase